MREIKFRAWDKKFKLLLKNVQNDQEILDRIHNCSMINTRMTFEDFVEDNGFRFVIEQYTGVKDKNGKEIYEGDLLKNTADTFDDVWEVSYHNCSFDAEYYDGINAGAHSLSNDFEIIGNIHENADLLKGNK